jgi:hypothetical protein
MYTIIHDENWNKILDLIITIRIYVYFFPFQLQEITFIFNELLNFKLCSGGKICKVLAPRFLIKIDKHYKYLQISL